MLPVTSRDVAGTQDKDPLSASDEGSGDVVDGGFFHADVVDGHHLAIGACLIVFYFVLVLISFFLLLWIEYGTSKCWIKYLRYLF